MIGVEIMLVPLIIYSFRNEKTNIKSLLFEKFTHLRITYPKLEALKKCSGITKIILIAKISFFQNCETFHPAKSQNSFKAIEGLCYAHAMLIAMKTFFAQMEFKINICLKILHKFCPILNCNSVSNLAFHKLLHHIPQGSYRFQIHTSHHSNMADHI